MRQGQKREFQNTLYELKLAVVNLEKAVREALVAGELPEVEVLRAA